MFSIVKYKSQNQFWHYHEEAKGVMSLAEHNIEIKGLGRALRNRGAIVRFVMMNDESYLNWLNGREDSSQHRAEWAKEQ